MPAINFTKFVDKVEDGRKTQTIRAQRKVPIKQGDWLYLFTGQRTACSRRLAPYPIRCLEVHTIYITRSDDFVAVYQDGIRMDSWAVESLARADGFDSMKDFFAFFVPDEDSGFKGHIIRWKWWAEPWTLPIPKITEATR